MMYLLRFIANHDFQSELDLYNALVEITDKTSYPATVPDKYLVHIFHGEGSDNLTRDPCLTAWHAELRKFFCDKKSQKGVGRLNRCGIFAAEFVCALAQRVFSEEALCHATKSQASRHVIDTASIRMPNLVS